jgi:hypothetical protein
LLFRLGNLKALSATGNCCMFKGHRPSPRKEAVILPENETPIQVHTFCSAMRRPTRKHSALTTGHDIQLHNNHGPGQGHRRNRTRWKLITSLGVLLVVCAVLLHSEALPCPLLRDETCQLEHARQMHPGAVFRASLER